MRILRTLFLAACVAAGAAMESGGEAKAEPLRITVTKPHPHKDRLRWLAKQFVCMRDAVFTEVRGEVLEGQRMVAWIVQERALENRPYWGGGSHCDVVHAVSVTKGGTLVSQFSGPIHHPVEVLESDRELIQAEEVVQQIVYGLWEPPAHLACARYYLNLKTADPSRASWFKKLKFAGEVGRHAFFCD